MQRYISSVGKRGRDGEVGRLRVRAGALEDKIEELERVQRSHLADADYHEKQMNRWKGIKEDASSNYNDAYYNEKIREDERLMRYHWRWAHEASKEREALKKQAHESSNASRLRVRAGALEDEIERLERVRESQVAAADDHLHQMNVWKRKEWNANSEGSDAYLWQKTKKEERLMRSNWNGAKETAKAIEALKQEARNA